MAETRTIVRQLDATLVLMYYSGPCARCGRNFSTFLSTRHPDQEMVCAECLRLAEAQHSKGTSEASGSSG